MNNPPVRHLQTIVLVQMREQLHQAVRTANERLDLINRVLNERKDLPLSSDIETGEPLTLRGRRTTVTHGTDSGYYYHLRHWKTQPCVDCLRAHREAEAARERRRKGAA